MDYLLLKRVIDVAVSVAVLLVLWPLLLAVAVIISMESPGSPLFFQVRIGRGCKPFRIVKFRSMVKNAAQLGPYHTADGDSRITKTGAFIRKTSIDELPQLWNVLTGEMSLIGPRPETPAQESLYTPADWIDRHRVRPGITGLAQVNGRSDITPEKRLDLDLAYAAGPTPKMDIDIVLKTISQVIKGSGTN